MKHKTWALFSASMAWSWMAAFAAMLVVLALWGAPAEAQDTTDPLADLPVNIVEDPGDNDNEMVDSIGPIAASGCVVEDDATLTIADEDDDQLVLTNGVGGVVITATEDEITIVGVGNAEAEFGTADSTVQGTVVESTGITCEDDTNTDGGTPGETEDKDEDVQINTICQNIIGSIGDINTSNAAIQYASAVGGNGGGGEGAAGGDAEAAAEIAQETGFTIAQVNECLNGSADTDTDDTGTDDTGTDDTGTDDTGTDDPGDVLTNTIPDEKVLANTGGPALLLPALGLLLISSVALRNLLRR